MEPDFVALAKYCQSEYKASLNIKRDKYCKTLFVAIKEDNSILVSTTPHILVNAHKCLLIHEHSSLAFTNSYLWYKIQFINENGEVFDNCIDNEFELSITPHGAYSNQVMELCADNIVYYHCIRPWEKRISGVWNLYVRLKQAKSMSERELISSLFERDENILDLEKQNCDFDFRTQLIEREKENYKICLDEIKELLKQND